jgi:hypothetical protein
MKKILLTLFLVPLLSWSADKSTKKTGRRSAQIADIVAQQWWNAEQRPRANAFIDSQQELVDNPEHQVLRSTGHHTQYAAPALATGYFASCLAKLDSTARAMRLESKHQGLPARKMIDAQRNLTRESGYLGAPDWDEPTLHTNPETEQKVERPVMLNRPRITQLFTGSQAYATPNSLDYNPLAHELEQARRGQRSPANDESQNS